MVTPIQEPSPRPSPTGVGDGEWSAAPAEHRRLYRPDNLAIKVQRTSAVPSPAKRSGGGRSFLQNLICARGGHPNSERLFGEMRSSRLPRSASQPANSKNTG